VGGLGQADDQALVLAAKEGSSNAFARIVERHQQPVRAFLRRLSGSHADADDLAQETFVSAWSRIGSFRPGESLKAWLCGIAYRKWLTYRRGQARRGVRERQAAVRGRGAAGCGDGARPARAGTSGLRRALPCGRVLARGSGGGARPAGGHGEVACRARKG
jgi:DNA-directed RNA polymerase specialized sigma24 family protein